MRAGGSGRADECRPLRSHGASVAHNTLRASRASRAGGSGKTLTDGAHRAGRALRADRANRTSRAHRAADDVADRASGALGPLFALRAFWALRASHSNQLRARGSDWALHARGPNGSFWASRPRRADEIE